jgi:hypothetical protein
MDKRKVVASQLSREKKVAREKNSNSDLKFRTHNNLICDESSM